MTTTCSIHRRTITIRSTSSDEYFSSREDLTWNATLGPSQRRRSPTPDIIDPGTSEWHIWAAEAADAWGEATNASPNNDPDYPSGTWNEGDREAALAQIEWDQPVPILDEFEIPVKQIDASPPYFAQEALAVPRAQFRYHSPLYNTHDPGPFAALQQNTIPFPTTQRNRVPCVPFRQWPDESDTSNSSTESDRGRQRQRGTNATGARLEESVPRLDHSSQTDPFNAEGPDYEWNTLKQIDRDILSPERVEAWEL